MSPCQRLALPFGRLGAKSSYQARMGKGKDLVASIGNLILIPRSRRIFFFLVKKFLSWCQKGSDELPTSSCPFFLSYLPPPARSSHVQTQADGAGALAVALPTRADYGTHPSPSWSLENSRSSLTDPTSPMYILSLNFTDPHRRFRVH